MRPLVPHERDGVVTASAADWKQLGDITAKAFIADPVTNWVLGNPASMPALFRTQARELYLKHGVCQMVGNEAATMWMQPGVSAEVPSSAMLKLLPKLIANGGFGTIARAQAVGEVMEANHPKDPHAYLFTIGAVPEGRGKGNAGKLLRAMLDVCDAQSVSAYLENSNPINHGLYSAFGFEKISEFRADEDAPPLAGMWRKPR